MLCLPDMDAVAFLRRGPQAVSAGIADVKSRPQQSDNGTVYTMEVPPELFGMAVSGLNTAKLLTSPSPQPREMAGVAAKAIRAMSPEQRAALPEVPESIVVPKAVESHRGGAEVNKELADFINAHGAVTTIHNIDGRQSQLPDVNVYFESRDEAEEMRAMLISKCPELLLGLRGGGHVPVIHVKTASSISVYEIRLDRYQAQLEGDQVPKSLLSLLHGDIQKSFEGGGDLKLAGREWAAGVLAEKALHPRAVQRSPVRWAARG